MHGISSGNYHPYTETQSPATTETPAEPEQTKQHRKISFVAGQKYFTRYGVWHYDVTTNIYKVISRTEKTVTLAFIGIEGKECEDDDDPKKYKIFIEPGTVDIEFVKFPYKQRLLALAKYKESPEQATAPAVVETETETENNENITSAQVVEDSITAAPAETQPATEQETHPAPQQEKITLQDPEYLQLTTSATENQKICNKKRRENSELINACKTAEEITELVCTLRYCTAIYSQMDYDNISPYKRPHVKDNTDTRPLAEFFAQEIIKRRERKTATTTQPAPEQPAKPVAHKQRKTDKDSQVMQDIIRDIDALTPEQINADWIIVNKVDRKN